jgi:orotate phosphoribosyltransferase
MPRPITLFTGQWADLPFEEVCRLASGWGYDGLEIACWGDHLDVERAANDDAYVQDRLEILTRHNLSLYAISNHLHGQAVCDDPIDERHKGIVNARVWGDGEPEGVRQRAAEEMKLTARAARKLGVDVVVGAETAGVPLAAAVSLAAGLPFAFVRKPGYRGHEVDEPPVRGAEVAGRRVLLVDDAVSSGTSVERFSAALSDVGAEVVGVFVLVDMREVADTVTELAAALPTQSVSTYLEVLDLAEANGLLDPAIHALSVDAIVNHWTESDPRWDLLPTAA